MITKLNKRRNHGGVAVPRSRVLLQLALIAGLSGGSCAPLAAQDAALLPAFPSTTAAPLLPSADAVVLADSGQTLPAFAGNAPSGNLHARLFSLLGLKKQQAKEVSVAMPLPSVSLPLPASDAAVVQTSAISVKQPDEEVNRLDAGAKSPEICLSSGTAASGNDDSQVDTADSLLAIDVEEEVTSTAATESIDSLLDIEIPLGGALAMEEPSSIAPAGGNAGEAHRAPEILKRRPAMQLNVGPSPSLVSATESLLPDTIEKDTSAIVTMPAVKRESIVHHKAVEMRIDDSADLEQPVNSVKPQPKQMAMRVETKPLPAEAPQTIEVSTSQPMVQSASVQVHSPTPPVNMTPTAPVAGKPLEVILQEAHNVECSSSVTNVSVEHPEYCQAIKNGDKSVSLLGLKAGKTRVAIFTSEDQGNTKIEIHEVTIADSEQAATDLVSLASTMNKTVNKMFPNSSVEIIATEEGLIVQGFAETEAEAKKIVRMIRKTSLQPVVDRLATHK